MYLVLFPAIIFVIQLSSLTSLWGSQHYTDNPFFKPFYHRVIQILQTDFHTSSQRIIIISCGIDHLINSDVLKIYEEKLT